LCLFHGGGAEPGDRNVTARRRVLRRRRRPELKALPKIVSTETGVDRGSTTLAEPYLARKTRTPLRRRSAVRQVRLLLQGGSLDRHGKRWQVEHRRAAWARGGILDIHGNAECVVAGSDDPVRVHDQLDVVSEVGDHVAVGEGACRNEERFHHGPGWTRNPEGALQLIDDRRDVDAEQDPLSGGHGDRQLRLGDRHLGLAAVNIELAAGELADVDRVPTAGVSDRRLRDGAGGDSERHEHE